MLILASQSPRRRELLGRITEQFIVRPTGCDESFTCADPAEHARQLALRKCAAAVTESAPEDAVIAADTVVFLDGVLLEKPASVAAAKAMLRRLSGHTHTVCTGVAVCYKSETRSFVQQTQVTFRPLPDSLIDWYVATGEPMDKAGAYGIQALCWWRASAAIILTWWACPSPRCINCCWRCRCRWKEPPYEMDAV